MDKFVELTAVSKHFDTKKGRFQALADVNLSIARGEFVALIGHSGCGKSTVARLVTGLHAPSSGEIRFAGRNVAGTPTWTLVKDGIAMIPEGRMIFRDMTVEDNLLIGGFIERCRPNVPRNLEMAYDLFPRLKERRRSQAGYTSGGEQQMVAMGRALMSRPETILLDEPSMGLAPQLVEQIFQIVKAVNEGEGVTFLLAEQNTNVALRYAHYGYILESGRVVMDGEAAALRENPDVKEFYLGMAEEGRKSFRDVRSYRRRKRWLA